MIQRKHMIFWCNSKENQKRYTDEKKRKLQRGVEKTTLAKLGTEWSKSKHMVLVKLKENKMRYIKDKKRN